MRVHCKSLFIATAVVSFAIGASAVEPSGSAANVPTPTTAVTSGINAATVGAPAKPSERLREGTKLIDAVGTFQSAGGDSISFSRDGGKEVFRVLENLALQRVGQALENNLNARHWIVSGIITEYRGANYLLLTKAVVQLQDGGAGGQ